MPRTTVCNLLLGGRNPTIRYSPLWKFCGDDYRIAQIIRFGEMDRISARGSACATGKRAAHYPPRHRWVAARSGEDEADAEGDGLWILTD